MLTPRENLLKVFRHETPEWIPIVGHVDPYNQPNREGMAPELAEALGEVQWHSEATVVFSRHLGIDIMDYYSAPVRISRRNVTVESSTTGDITTNVWHTPKGDLREVSRVCREDNGAVSSNYTEHLIKGPEDIPAFAAIFEDEQVELDEGALAQIKQRRALIGDDGMLMHFMAGTPLGMMYRVYSGVASLAYLWMDARAALLDLFQVMEKNYHRSYELAGASDADALVGMDDTSTTAISPAMFEICNVELTNERSALAHAAGKLYFHHSCGLIRHLLPIYRQTEIDAVHAYTIPPIGDATIADGRRELGDRITIIAGLGQLAGPMGDRDAVRTDIRKMFEQAAGSATNCGNAAADHFILGLAAYPNRTMEETKFILDVCREFQRR